MKSENLRILLADDDKDDCYFFREALAELPFTTDLTTFYDGEQMMQLLYAGAETLPDVLFLDLNMPRKSGFECLEEIKNNERFKHLPVIIFSTTHDEEMADKLFKNGARYYICKPTDFNQLVNVIHIALRLIIQDSDSLPDKEVFLINDLEKVLLA